MLANIGRSVFQPLCVLAHTLRGRNRVRLDTLRAMKVPQKIKPLVEEGLVDEVVRQQGRKKGLKALPLVFRV